MAYLRLLFSGASRLAEFVAVQSRESFLSMILLFQLTAVNMMKTATEEHQADNDAMIWNAVWHTTGMGVIKKKHAAIEANSGFGVVKKSNTNHNASQHAITSQHHPALEVVVDNTEKIGDAKLRKSVNRILVWMKIFPKDAVSVTIADGWMTLRGQVDWKFQRDVTVAAIGNLYGVKGCTDEIVILHPEQ